MLFILLHLNSLINNLGETIMGNIYFDVKKYIRAIEDWPEKGMIFRDITSLLEDKLVFKKLVDSFVHRYLNSQADAIVAIDARGFIIGSPLAYQLNTGFVPVRKKGYLPGKTISEPYGLEKDSFEMEMQTTSLLPGDRVLLVDDVIATGGTMLAAAKLIERLGAEVIEVATIIDLPDHGGSTRLQEAGLTVNAFCEYTGE